MEDQASLLEPFDVARQVVAVLKSKTMTGNIIEVRK